MDCYRYPWTDNHADGTSVRLSKAFSHELGNAHQNTYAQRMYERLLRILSPVPLLCNSFRRWKRWGEVNCNCTRCGCHLNSSLSWQDIDHTETIVNEWMKEGIWVYSSKYFIVQCTYLCTNITSWDVPLGASFNTHSSQMSVCITLTQFSEWS